MTEVSQEVVAVAGGNKPGGNSWRRLVDLAAVSTVLLLVSSWIFLLNGRSYHDGYIKYLNHEASMFPITNSDAALYGAVAWFKLISGILDRISKGSVWVVMGLLGGVLFFVLTCTVLNGYLAQKTFLKRKRKPSLVERFPLVKSCYLNGLLVFITFYATAGLSIFIVLAIAMMINPFRNIGKEAAQFDLNDEYRTAPWIQLQAPESSSPERFRVVECSAQFCALYRKPSVVAVPVGKVEWVEALPPGQKASR